MKNFCYKCRWCDNRHRGHVWHTYHCLNWTANKADDTTNPVNGATIEMRTYPNGNIISVRVSEVVPCRDINISGECDGWEE